MSYKGGEQQLSLKEPIMISYLFYFKLTGYDFLLNGFITALMPLKKMEAMVVLLITIILTQIWKYV